MKVVKKTLITLLFHILAILRSADFYAQEATCYPPPLPFIKITIPFFSRPNIFSCNFEDRNGRIFTCSEPYISTNGNQKTNIAYHPFIGHMICAQFSGKLHSTSFKKGMSKSKKKITKVICEIN